MTTADSADAANTDDITARMNAARQFALASREVTMRWFGASDIDLRTKSDGTPVTIADKTCELFLREQISAQFPSDAILGEEHDDRPGTSGYRWVLDPIDGTFSFTHAVPLFGTLIGVEYNGTCVAGVICMPALDECIWAGDNLGAFGTFRGDTRPIAVSTTPTIERSTIAYTDADLFNTYGHGDAFNALTRAAAYTRGWCDCYAHLLVATGRIDAAVEPVMAHWDLAPFPVIMREAGGHFSDLTGNAATPVGSAISSNGKVHDELVAMFARA